MTVSNTQIRVGYTGDGVSTAFPIPYPFYLATDILVLLNGATQSSGYAISGGEDASGNPQTGTCTFASVPVSGASITVILNVPLTQLVELVDGTTFPSATINQVNDRATQAALRLNDLISRAIRAPDGDTTPSMLLPPAAQRALQYSAFDAGGNAIAVAALPGSNITPASLGAVLYPISSAESNAGIVPTNIWLPYGWVDRYGTNSIPGTTNMLAAVQSAFAQALQPGGAPIVFQPVKYFLGTISSVSTTLLTVTGLTNCTVHGNGAQLVTNTTVFNSSGSPTVIYFVNPSNVTIRGLGQYDSGFDITQTWKGPFGFRFSITDSTDRAGINIEDCYFYHTNNPTYFTNSGGGSGRLRGIKITGCTYDTCYNGPNFTEQGDCAEINVTTINCLRNYFPYGVAGHNAHVHVWHDGVSTGANACIDIKRYINDTRNIRVKVDFHGYTSQFGALVNFETQMTTGTASITALGSITAGTGGSAGIYYGVPLTGGSGSGATANILVGSGGGVIRVDIANPEKNYAAGDVLSAASANIGGCTGFSVPVSAVGAIIDGIDIDIDLTDAQTLGGAGNVAFPVQFRSLTAADVLNPTTTDRWDRISLRGNVGQGATMPINILSVMTGVPPGRIVVEPGLVGFSQNISVVTPTVYPGFVLRTAANEEIYFLTGNLTTAPLSIDLSQYQGRFFSLLIDVEAESDYSFNSNVTTQSFVVQGFVSASNLAVSIGTSSSIYTAQISGGTSAAPTIGASGSNLTVTFSNYTAANAGARVHVRHLARLR